MAQKITRTLLLAITFIFVLALFSLEIKDPDFWWHLKTGEYIVQTGSIPDADPFAYTSTPKDPLSPESVRIKFILAQYWLAQVLFYKIYTAFGLQGIIFLRAFILALLVFFIYRGIRREGMGLYASLILTIPVVLILYTFTGERPQLFSFLFSFLVVFLMEGFRRSETPGDSSRLIESQTAETRGDLQVSALPSQSISTNLNVSQLVSGLHQSQSVSSSQSDSLTTAAARNFSLPTVYCLLSTVFMMFLWSNLHGGYIVGIAVLGCYLIGEWVKYIWIGRRNPEMAKSEKSPLSPLCQRGEHTPYSPLDRGETILPSAKGGKEGFYNHQCNAFGSVSKSNVLPLKSLKLFSAFIIVAILVTLINPNSYKVIPFLIELEGGLYKSFIIETMSPLVLFRSGFYEIQFFIFFGLLLALALLFLLRIRHIDLTDLILIALLALASLSMSRFIPYFAPVAVLLIARYSHETVRRMPKIFETIRKNIEIPANSFFIIVLILMLINGDMFKSGIRGNKYPEGAAQFLKENRIAGNMFNPYVWGGYLMWTLYPDYKVFVDGRGLIPEVFFQEVRVLEASQKPVEGIPEWKAILNAYKVNFIVTFSVGNFTGRLIPLIPALLNDQEWHLVYMDNISLIFARGSTENSEFINRFGIPKEWLWNEVAVEAALKVKDAPNRAAYFETMGDALFAKRSYQEAREAYVKAFELKPGDNLLRSHIEQLDAIIRSQGQ